MKFKREKGAPSSKSMPETPPDMEYDEEVEYYIVGSSEANSLQGKISNESPVGAALIGHRPGDIVEVETQAGKIQFKVLEIKRQD